MVRCVSSLFLARGSCLITTMRHALRGYFAFALFDAKAGDLRFPYRLPYEGKSPPPLSGPRNQRHCPLDPLPAPAPSYWFHSPQCELSLFKPPVRQWHGRIAGFGPAGACLAVFRAGKGVGPVFYTLVPMKPSQGFPFFSAEFLDVPIPPRRFFPWMGLRQNAVCLSFGVASLVCRKPCQRL